MDLQIGGYYWCASQFLGNAGKAFLFSTTGIEVTLTDGCYRYFGFSVRLVREFNPAVEAIDYTTVCSAPVKIISNGQIFILRDEKTYTITGSQMR